MYVTRIALLSVLFSLIACGQREQVADTPPPAESVLTFVHLNDTYRIDAVEEGRAGGFARVATIVKRLLAEGRDVRITHGGDFLYPSLESQLWDGEQMVEAFNYLDGLTPMYVVPGNHEFDPRDPEPVVDAVRGSAFEWLGDNVRLATGQSDVDEGFQSTFTFMSGGRKVGIFALTLHADDGGNDREYAPVDKDYVAAAEQALSRLRRENVDLIVGLTHLHIETDREIARLREDHPRFLFILGGHEHEPEYEPATPASAAIMKGASNARVVWQVGVRFDAPGAATEIVPERIVVDESIPQDDGYVGISDRWRARLLALYPFLESTVGYAALPLDAREVTVRNEESAWANFIVDRMRTAFAGTPSDLAFINSGTLRLDDWVAEDVTFEDIARTFGFSSYLRYMTIRGEDFRELMEAGYRGTGPSKGYFPQVSGFRVCVDRARPEGQRIVQMLVRRNERWTPIEPEADYLLVAPDYLYGGGDGYDFAEARDVSRPGSELKYQVLDGVIRAQAEGQKVGEPVDPQVPRIAFLGPGRERCFEL